MINRSMHRLVVVVLVSGLVLLAIYYTSRPVVSPVEPGRVATLASTALQAHNTPTAAQTSQAELKSPPVSPLQPTALAVAVSPLTISNALTSPIGNTAMYTPALYSYSVVKSYPHDPTAWTEGLLFDNGALYEGTGENGRSFVRKIELETGKVLQQISLPAQYYGEGIVIFDDKLYQLTYQTHIGFVYNKTTLALLKTFTYPTEGWGFTHDGAHLIMSDGSARLTYLDPTTLQASGHLDVFDAHGPVRQLNELEYRQGKIYANIWMTNRIAIISPQTGQVTAYIDLTGLLPAADQAANQWLNGIAYLPKEDRLFVTGKHWPKLFEIRLTP